jgi:hypothetical protein
MNFSNKNYIRNAGGLYHKTNDIYDYGKIGITDEITAINDAVVTLDKNSYPLPTDASKVIFNKDRGKILAIVGKDYKLVTHKECFNEFYKKSDFQNILKAHSDYTCHYWNTGTAIKAVITFNDNLNITSSTDTGKMSIVIWNSVDAKTSFQAQLGLVRVLCANGMIFLNTKNLNDFRIRQKKTSGFFINQIASDFSKSVDMFQSNIKWLNKLNETFLSELWIKNFLILMCTRNKSQGMSKKNLSQKRFRFLYSLFQKYEKEMGPTAYALFNALTDDSTRPNQEWFDAKTGNTLSSGKTIDECRLQVIGKQRQLEWLKAISVEYGKLIFFIKDDMNKESLNAVDYTSSIE